MASHDVIHRCALLRRDNLVSSYIFSLLLQIPFFCCGERRVVIG